MRLIFLLSLHPKECKNMDFDIIQDINVDAAISFGKDCRAAESLRRNKARFFSSPFDWMMKYSLDDVFNILQNKGKNFFSDYKQTGEDRKKKFYYMVSESTGMVSMHHFRKDIPIEDSYFIFRCTMDKRFRELDEILTNAKSICIVTSRKIELDGIKDFLEKFETLYDFEKIYYINIYNSNQEEKIVKTEYDNITVYECYFEDIHPDGKDPNINKKFWKGNIEYWDKILKHIKLNKKFVRNFRYKKMVSDLSFASFKKSLKVSYIKYKYKILRSLKLNSSHV